MPNNSRWCPERAITPERRADWVELISYQAGILTVEQARQFGTNRKTIAANVEAGRWQRVLPRTYATFTGPLTQPSRIAAALLYGGPHAILSHRTAAEAWHLLPAAGGPVEITVPYTSSAVCQLPLTRVHRSRAMRSITVASDPRRTSRVDTILDLAVDAETAEQAVQLFVELGGRGGVPLARLARCLETRPPYRYRRELERALRLVTDGVRSVLELEYVQRVEAAHGVGPASRQTPVIVDDRMLYEDVTYDETGVALTVRLDGRAYHSTPGVAFRDRRRDNAAELAGRCRLVYGWDDVHHNPCGVAGEVVAVLQRGGWQGIPHRCSRECRAPF